MVLEMRDELARYVPRAEARVVELKNRISEVIRVRE